MSVGVIILLLVPPGEAQTPLVSGVVSAAARALGTDARVLVDSPAPASDDDAVALADRLHANAVVTLRWMEGGRVSLHVHWSGEPGWTDRFFAFNDADAMDERGRTIGFTLAAWVRTEVPRARGPTFPAEVPRVRGPTFPPEVPRAPPSWPRFRVSLEALAQVHVAAHAPSWGAGLRGAFSIAPRLELTAGAAWSTGTVNDVDGQLRIVSLAAGVRIPVVVARPDRPYEIAVAGEAVASQQALSRTQTGGEASQTDGRWLAGAQFRLGTAWFFTPRIAAVAALGARADFGGTDIVVNRRTATTLSPYGGTAELGLRVRF